MSLDEIKTRDEWGVLTAKQKAFLEAYIRSGMDTGTYDGPAAVRVAYGTKVEKNAVIFSYELLAHRKIAPLLNLHFGRSEREAQAQKLEADRQKLLRKVRRALRHVESGGIAEQRLLAQEERLVLGGKPEADDEPGPAAPEVSTAGESAPPSSIPIFPPAEPKYKVSTIANDPDDGKPYILLAVSADGNDVTEARLLTKNDDGTFFDAVAQGTPPTYDHVPPGARPGYAETTHALIGYGTADGKTVWLIEAAAAR